MYIYKSVRVDAHVFTEDGDSASKSVTSNLLVPIQKHDMIPSPTPDSIIQFTDQFSQVSQLAQFFWKRNQFVVAGYQNLQRKTADHHREDRQLIPTEGEGDR